MNRAAEILVAGGWGGQALKIGVIKLGGAMFKGFQLGKGNFGREDKFFLLSSFSSTSSNLKIKAVRLKKG